MKLLLIALTSSLLFGVSHSARDSDINIPVIEVVQEIQKPTISSVATEIIKQYEGLSLEAYKDTDRYSIGYGTKSYYGEVIDEQEATTRLAVAVDAKIAIVTSENTGTVNQLAALTSLLYNCPSCYNRVKKNPSKSLRLAHDKVCKSGVCKPLRGLTLRRKAERQLFTSI